MIVSNIHQRDNTLSLQQPIQKILDIFQNTDFNNVEDGVYEVDGKDLFYMVIRSTNVNKEESLFEAHKHYLDLQYIFSGQEQMGYALFDENLGIQTPYIPERDITFYDFPKVSSYLTVSSGDFVIFSPNDLHAPAVKVDGKDGNVIKVVGKIKTSILK